MHHLNNLKLKACWQALRDNVKEQKREKNKVRRCMTIFSKYLLYHMWRRYTRQASYET